MKMIYQAPLMEINAIAAEDILTLSTDGTPGFGGDKVVIDFEG